MNALCCFSHNSSSHVLKLTWCCIMLPTYSLRLFPQQQFLCFFCSSPSSSPPHASVHLQNIILPSASVVLFLLSVCYWNVTIIGESMLETSLNMKENMQMEKKIFWCVFKCFWMQFWKTHKWHGCLPWYSVLLPLFITSGNYACKFTLYKYRTYYEHVSVITHNSTLFICCRSTMQQPA